MKIRLISCLLCFGITASVSYGGSGNPAVSLAPLDNVSQSNIVFGSATVEARLPGGNAFEGSLPTVETGAIPSAAVPVGFAVPEPSQTGLICFGLLGLIALQIRRRQFAK
jgi:hypothetical protein